MQTARSNQSAAIRPRARPKTADQRLRHARSTILADSFAKNKLAADAGVLFSVAAFTTYGGWGSEFRNKYVEPFYNSELKDAKAKGGDGWDVLNRKNRFVRHVAAVLCREEFTHALKCCSHAPRWEPRRSTWPVFPLLA
jgi:hypothetical protein